MTASPELWPFPPLLIAVVQSRARHVFAKPAFLEEVLFQPADLLIEEEVGLVDEAEGNVG